MIGLNKLHLRMLYWVRVHFDPRSLGSYGRVALRRDRRHALQGTSETARIKAGKTPNPGSKLRIVNLDRSVALEASYGVPVIIKCNGALAEPAVSPDKERVWLCRITYIPLLRGGFIAPPRTGRLTRLPNFELFDRARAYRRRRRTFDPGSFRMHHTQALLNLKHLRHRNRMLDGLPATASEISQVLKVKAESTI
jgi:hypothetical protein